MELPIIRKVKTGIFITSKKPKGARHPYNVALEYGTKKMKPRPFFYSTIHAQYKKIRKKLIKKIKATIKNDFEAQIHKRRKIRYG